MKKTLSWLLILTIILSATALSGCMNSIRNIDFDDENNDSYYDSNNNDNDKSNEEDSLLGNDSFNEYEDEPSDLPPEELIIGKWEGTIDLKKLFKEIINSANADITLSNDTSAELSIIQTYKENGEVTFELLDLDKVSEDLKKVIIPIYTYNWEQEAAKLDMTAEELLASRGYSSIEEYADMIVDIAVKMGLSKLDGRTEAYYFEKGKLITYTEESQTIHTYALSKNTLKLIEVYENGEKEDNPIFPMTLHRIE